VTVAAAAGLAGTTHLHKHRSNLHTRVGWNWNTLLGLNLVRGATAGGLAGRSHLHKHDEVTHIIE
jgi:hypothetical protein